MASVAADYIAANQETMTGSIGVIISTYDMTGLYEKLGIRYISITSGPMKDSTKMTDEQIQEILVREKEGVIEAEDSTCRAFRQSRISSNH